VKRLLLIGGGHSHIEVIRQLGPSRGSGATVTLVSSDRYTPYSGMLPGLIAGHYAYEDCHIDLEELCGAAAVNFVRGTVQGLLPDQGVATLAGGGEARFDLASIDVGSTPGTNLAPGAADHAIGAKPVARLLEKWKALLAAAQVSAQHVIVVGGGPGGVELGFAMQYRLRADSRAGSRVDLVTDTPVLLPEHPRAAQRHFGRLAVERGIALHLGHRVAAVEPGLVRLDDGTRLKADWIFWATGASPARWLAKTGLAVDSRGYIQVNDALQSVSHPAVFAAGDCASLLGRNLPKSGVFAVRQGPVLAANLARALEGRPLVRYRPQRGALALISTGGKHAVASWKGLALAGDWVWRWKDRIDRRFVDSYRATPAAVR